MRPEVVILKSRLVASGDVTADEGSWRIRVIHCIRTPRRLWGWPSQVRHEQP